MVEAELERIDQQEKSKSSATSSKKLFEDLVLKANCKEYYQDCLKCKYIRGEWKNCNKQVLLLCQSYCSCHFSILSDRLI